MTWKEAKREMMFAKRNVLEGSYIDQAYDKAIEALSQQERKTGEWFEITNTNHTYVCSVCGRMLVNITDGKNKVTKNYPFCHCGADMRGEQDDPNCD